MSSNTVSTSATPTINASSSNEEMTPQKAVEVLVQCAYVGQSRGAWRMEEVPVILKAIAVFQQRPAQSQ